MSTEETNFSSSAPLHKGRACMNCRRRKIKCDGVKPQCGPCASSSGSFRDCEYSDQGFTPTQLLEERIAVLEARLHELENPDQNTDSLTLHNPYNESDLFPSQADQPALTLTTPPRYRISDSLSEPLPDELRNILIHNFLSHSLELGFFLDPVRFRMSVLEGAGGVSPALLNAVYLSGCHLSNSLEIRALEPILASRTQRALSGPPLQAVLQWVQAEVLMAQYLFSKARTLEAKYHSTAAVSLVLSAGLHNMHAQRQPSSHPPPVLQPPADATEQGERINAFWTVLILNNCWVVSDGFPNISFDASDSRIDVPWPKNLSQYHQLPIPAGSQHPIRNFLAGHRDGGSSILALHAKAAIMYEQSAQLPRQYHHDMFAQETAQFLASFSSLDNLLASFIQELPSIRPSDSSTLTVIHTLVHVAVIQLHSPFIAQNSTAYTRVRVSARAVVQTIRVAGVERFQFIDPIFASLCAITYQALIACISQAQMIDRNSLNEDLEILSQTMEALAPRSPIMDLELAKIRGS